MKKYLAIFVVAAAFGALALVIWQQRKAIASVNEHKKTILDAADAAGALSTLWDDVKREVKGK